MDQQIRAAFERCQRRFPTLRVSLESYADRIHQILSSDVGLTDEKSKTAAFDKIHHEDLYFAIACTQDDRVAWEYFGDDYLPVLRSFAQQACGNSFDAEDLAQEITAKLMKDKSRLAGYNGRGSLNSWLRVAVSHAAVDRFRRAARTTSLEELEENGAPGVLMQSAPAREDETLDSRWGPVVTRITAETLRGLPARDRLILSLYYLQGVSLKEIGGKFGIHEATASRWLERMRQDIRKGIERELRKKHKLTPAEINSLWQWISPASLTESLRGEAGGTPGTRDGSSARKAAIGEKPSVIEKEELQ